MEKRVVQLAVETVTKESVDDLHRRLTKLERNDSKDGVKPFEDIVQQLTLLEEQVVQGLGTADSMLKTALLESVEDEWHPRLADLEESVRGSVASVTKMRTRLMALEEQ